MARSGLWVVVAGVCITVVACTHRNGRVSPPAGTTAADGSSAGASAASTGIAVTSEPAAAGMGDASEPPAGLPQPGAGSRAPDGQPGPQGPAAAEPASSGAGQAEQRPAPASVTAGTQDAASAAAAGGGAASASSANPWAEAARAALRPTCGRCHQGDSGDQPAEGAGRLQSRRDALVRSREARTVREDDAAGPRQQAVGRGQGDSRALRRLCAGRRL